MDYEFFEALTPDEARAYLERFLEVEAEKVRGTVAAARAAGVQADYSVDSIPGFLSWLAPQINVVQVEPPEGIEPWIREAMEQHHGGFRAFDEATRPLVLRAAYYLGQSFVSTYPKLRWALGARGVIHFQQPVITGLRARSDLPALVVTENIFLDHLGPVERKARTMVETWCEAV